MHDLQRFLIDYDMAMLRALAQNRGAELATNRRYEAAEQLATALLEPLSVRTALARLSAEGQAALEALLAAGGRMRAPHFFRQFGPVRPIGPGRLEREAPWQDPASPTEELLYLGFLFRAFAQSPSGPDTREPGEFVFVPNDLIALLPRPNGEPPAFAIEVVPGPGEEPDGGGTFVEDFFAYLVYLQTHDVQPGQLDEAALAGRLADPDPRRLALLRHLAQRLDLVVQREGHLRLQAGPVKVWLTAPPARRLAALQEAWRDDPGWNDLCRVPGLRCDLEAGWENDPVATRRAVLALLARCPVDAWWTLDSFVAAVKQAHPDFQRPDGDYASWYIRDAESGEYLSGFDSWPEVEGALLADLLAGPLRWLGVVAVASTERGLACRLTVAGARLLGLAPEPQAQPSPPIVVRPDLAVVIPPPVNLYARFQLERFAEPQSRAPCRYRLTAGGLGRVLGRGIRVEQIVTFLRQASEDRLPANVEAQLRLWAGRYGQVRVEEVALLTVRSERTLKELSVLPETRDLLARVLSSTTALVRQADLLRLRRVLRELGYLPPEDR